MQDLNVVYQVCVFEPIGRQDGVMVSDWLTHFQFLLWNRWTEFNKSLTESRSQRPLPSLCFSDQSENKIAALASDCLTFPNSLLKLLNLTGNNISMYSTRFVFFGPIGKTRWPPWPLISLDIYYFSCETTERNSTKLDRKQDLNVLYHGNVFWLIGKTRWPSWPLIGLYISTSPLKRQNEFSETWQEAWSQSPLPSLCFSGRSKKKKEKKMTVFVSVWLRHFRLLLWNCWMEFNKTCQKARSQRPLPCTCFSGRSKKRDGRPGLWFAETFSISPLKPLNGIQRNLTGSKISTSSTKFVFYWADQKNNMAVPTDLSIKVAHCTQCKICGSLGPLFLSSF